MAVLLSGSVAVGVVILSLLKGYRGELHRYLFGDILATGPAQVWFAALIAGLGSCFLSSSRCAR
jgi:ABC-type Mn2+/Zn2+ transport system permease subunit